MNETINADTQATSEATTQSQGSSVPVSDTNSKGADSKSEVSSSSDKEPKHKDFRSAMKYNLKIKDEVEGLQKVDKEEKESTTSSKTETVREEKPEVIIAPSDMTAEERATWDKLPKEYQKYLSRRAYETNNTFLQKTKKAAEYEKQLEPILNTVKQYESEYIRAGVKIPDVIQRSLEWDRHIKSTGAAGLLEMAQTYGITPQQLVQHLQGQTQQQVNQPSPQYLTPQQAEEIAERKVNDRLLAEQRRYEAQSFLKSREDIANSFISSTPFAADANSRAQLENAMAPFVAAKIQTEPNADPKAVLQEVYDYVTTKDPRFSSVRQLHEAKPLADTARQVAQRATTASRSISGGPGTSNPNREVKSFRDDLRMRLNGSLS